MSVNLWTGDMCYQFLSLSDYPCYEIRFLKGCKIYNKLINFNATI